MHLIKSATSYRIHLPQNSGDLAELCAKKPFVELAPSDFAGAGFVAPLEGNLTASFEGGYAFSVRYDEKIVPASVTNAEAKKRIAELEEAQDFRMGRKERQRVREEVFHDLTLRALVRTQVVTSFFLPEHNLLLVPTTSKKLAYIVTRELCRVMESVKATTIYVSSVKASLTTQLQGYLMDAEIREEGDTILTHFTVGTRCQLRTEEGRRYTFVLTEDLEEANAGIQEAMDAGAQVSELELFDGTARFRLGQDFKLKGIDTGDPAESSSFDDHVELWKHEAAVQTRAVAAVVNALCEVLDFKDPAEKVAAPNESAFA
jgi:recombination associated protein RdgC